MIAAVCTLCALVAILIWRVERVAAAHNYVTTRLMMRDALQVHHDSDQSQND